MTKRNRIGIAVAALSLVAIGALAQTPRTKSLYRTFRFSNAEVGVSCMDGETPTSHTIGSVLVVKCGQ